MRYFQVTEPAREPVGLQAVKMHAVIAHTDDNLLLLNWISVAREQIESDTGRALIAQQWQLELECWPENSEILIRKPPLISVDSVLYTDVDGAEQSIGVVEYQVGECGGFPCIKPAYGLSWPAIRPGFGAVKVLFTAGYQDSDQKDKVPKSLVQALCLLVAHYDQNREIVAPIALHETPMAYQSLIHSYRVKPTND